MTSTMVSLRPRISAIISCGILFFFLTCIFFSCTQKPKPLGLPEPLPGFELPPGGTLWLGLSTDDSYVPWPLPDSGNEQAAIVPSNFAVHRGPAAIEPLPGGGAILASNRSGLQFISLVESSAVDARFAQARFVFKSIGSADPAFARRTVAGSWLRKGKAMFLLSRNPIFETEPFEAPGYSFISADANGSEIWQPPSSIAGVEDYAVYACYPQAPDSWAIQMRKDTDDRVDMLYELWTPDTGKRQDISKGVFEKTVSPEAIARAPQALRDLAAQIEGSIIVSCRMADGSRRAFLKGNSGEETASAYAQIYSDGALLVAGDGRGYYKNKGLPLRSIAIPLPVPDATIRDAALVDGVLVIIWEEDLFPDVGDCGLMIFNLGL